MCESVDRFVRAWYLIDGPNYHLYPTVENYYISQKAVFIKLVISPS